MLNECDVKTHAGACNSPWEEMVGLHKAVGVALHEAYHNATTNSSSSSSSSSSGSSDGSGSGATAATNVYSARPIVCGPTEAFPEYVSSLASDLCFLLTHSLTD